MEYEEIFCQVCGKKCKGKRGISHHVLQYSKKCFNEYIKKYGTERTKWPGHTKLNIKTCEDCGQALKDPRSIKYCAFCRSHNHNVMKRKEVVKKNLEKIN